MRPKGKGTSQKKKRCVKSTAYPCGFACINIKDKCHNVLHGQAATFVLWEAKMRERLAKVNAHRTARGKDALGIIKDKGLSKLPSQAKTQNPPQQTRSPKPDEFKTAIAEATNANKASNQKVKESLEDWENKKTRWTDEAQAEADGKLSHLSDYRKQGKSLKSQQPDNVVAIGKAKGTNKAKGDRSSVPSSQVEDISNARFNSKLKKGDVVGAIDDGIKTSEDASKLAKDAIAELDRHQAEMEQRADEVRAKYRLLGEPDPEADAAQARIDARKKAKENEAKAKVVPIGKKDRPSVSTIPSDSAKFIAQVKLQKEKQVRELVDSLASKAKDKSLSAEGRNQIRKIRSGINSDLLRLQSDLDKIEDKINNSQAGKKDFLDLLKNYEKTAKEGFDKISDKAINEANESVKKADESLKEINSLHDSVHQLAQDALAKHKPIGDTTSSVPSTSSAKSKPTLEQLKTEENRLGKELDELFKPRRTPELQKLIDAKQKEYQAVSLAVRNFDGGKSVASGEAAKDTMPENPYKNMKSVGYFHVKEKSFASTRPKWEGVIKDLQKEKEGDALFVSRNGQGFYVYKSGGQYAITTIKDKKAVKKDFVSAKDFEQNFRWYV